MSGINTKVTDSVNFFQGNDPKKLVEEYGSPLYVYNERIFRERCRDIKNLQTLTLMRLKENYIVFLNV